MSRKSRQRPGPEPLEEPQILPMMNVLFMLVMVLMGMSAFLPIGVIAVQAPQFGGSASDSGNTRPELNLAIMILKTGINLSVSGNIITGFNNLEELRAKLESIKMQYPGENRVILMAEPDIIYDQITHVMDAARVSASGKIMFNEVAFVPGIIQ